LATTWTGKTRRSFPNKNTQKKTRIWVIEVFPPEVYRIRATARIFRLHCRDAGIPYGFLLDSEQLPRIVSSASPLLPPAAAVDTQSSPGSKYFHPQSAEYGQLTEVSGSTVETQGLSSNFAGRDWMAVTPVSWMSWQISQSGSGTFDLAHFGWLVASNKRVSTPRGGLRRRSFIFAELLGIWWWYRCQLLPDSEEILKAQRSTLKQPSTKAGAFPG